MMDPIKNVILFLEITIENIVIYMVNAKSFLLRLKARAVNTMPN